MVLHAGDRTLGGTATFTDSVNLYGTGNKRLSSATLRGAGDAPALRFAAVGGAYDRNGPALSDFGILNRQGVEIGDRTLAIADGTGQAVFHYWKFDRLNIVDGSLNDSPDNLGAVGVSVTKAFDGRMQLCEVLGYRIGVLLNGADINVVTNNRLHNQQDYAILEASAGSFGSQTTISENDILGTPSKAFYKTTGRHVRFNNNYLEASTNLPAGAGFIDISPATMPAFGGNVRGDTLSVILRDNRLDGQGRATFNTRIFPDNATTIRLEEIQTSDGSSTPSYFCRADGARDDLVPLFGPGGRARRLYLDAPTMGPVWEGYRVEGGVTLVGDRWQITGRNVSAFPFNTPITGVDGFAKIYGDQVVIPATQSGKNLAVFPGGFGGGNKLFAADRLYEVALVARSDLAAGDSIEIQMAGTNAGGGGFGTRFQSAAIDDQAKAYRFYFQGQPADYQAVGFHIRSPTSLANIFFTLSWVEVHGYWQHPVRIGGQYYWTDDGGKLRKKASPPTAADDGDVIGPYDPPVNPAP